MQNTRVELVPAVADKYVGLLYVDVAADANVNVSVFVGAIEFRFTPFNGSVQHREFAVPTPLAPRGVDIYATQSGTANVTILTQSFAQ